MRMYGMQHSLHNILFYHIKTHTICEWGYLANMDVTLSLQNETISFNHTET